MPNENTTTTSTVGGTTVTTETTPTVDLKAKVELVDDKTTFTMDQFLEADFSNDSEIDAIFKQEHKNLPAFQEIVKRHTTPEGRKLIANLRSDYSRKTQELAAATKRLEEERLAFQKERELIINSEFNKRNAQLATEDVTGLDIYTDEGMKKYLDVEMAKRLEEQIKPLREKAASEAKILAVEKFIVEHPEIKTEAYKQKLMAIYEKNPNVELDTAFLMAKGMLADEVKITEANKKTETRNYIKETPTGRQVDLTAIPAGLSARQVAQMLAKK